VPRKRYNIVLDPSVVEDVKAQLGDTSFSRFTERALEAMLGDRRSTDGLGLASGAAKVAGPVSPRASEPEPHESVDIAVAAMTARACEKCGKEFGSPSLRRCTVCNGKIVPEPS
jgi:hypothetical protein